MESGVARLTSAERALDKVETGLKLVDTVLKIGEGAGLPLIPAVCSAARSVLQVVQASRTVISDVLSAAQRTIDVLELLQRMAENVERMDVKSRASVEGRMRELQRLLDDVRTAVAAFGKKGWLRHALQVKWRNAFSQLDSEITGQLGLLLLFYNLARDADIIDRLQAREYAVEAEVVRQVAERKAVGEAVDEKALEEDSEVVRGIAVASGVSDAEFQEELTREMREGFAQQGLKLDKIIAMMANLTATGIGNAEPDRSSRMSLYAYDRKPDAPPGQRDKLAARLGRGSFGTTYRMRKVAGIDARRYAVKMIESEELDGAGLEKEARLLSMIEHENTLRFYDAFWHDSEDGRLFVIVTELLTGGSLAEKISAAPPPAEVAALVRQVASGLAYMHSLNLQHRDLKPANVMLDSTGRAKIIYFGLACVIPASHHSRMGTDAYMSPEKTDGGRYGPADDVWAAGCILAELLLGRTIGYVALDAAKRQRAIAESKSASEQLGLWVESCLQESPGRRPTAAMLDEAASEARLKEVESPLNSAPDTTLSIMTYWDVSNTNSFKRICQRFKALVQRAPGVKYYGFSINGNRAVSKEGHANFASYMEYLRSGAQGVLFDAMSVAAITNMEAHGPKDEVGQLEVSQKNLLSSHWAYVDGAFFVPSKYLRQPSQGPLVSDETLCVLVYWKIKDYAKFLAGVKDFQHLTRQEEKVKYYGFCVYGSKAICREGYDSAEGFLEHLQNVDGPLKTAMQCADIESVEVHGPSSEVNKLRERLKSFPAVFWPYPNDSFLAPAQFSCEPLREAEEQRIRRDAADRYAADKARARQKAVDRSRRERARQKEEERAWQEAVERSRREAEEELQARTAQLQIAVAAAEAGDFAPLVSLARDGTDGQKEQAARALRNLACNADNQVAIARAGGRRSAAGAA